jgi:hypothetical protein
MARPSTANVNTVPDARLVFDFSDGAGYQLNLKRKFWQAGIGT